MTNRKVKVIIEQIFFVDEDQFETYEEFKSHVRFEAELIKRRTRATEGNQTDVIDIKLISGGQETSL